MSKILGIDVSTKTCGLALFEDKGTNGELIYLHHINPKIKLPHLKSKDKPSEKDKMEMMIGKADLVKQLLEEQYKDLDITRVIVEEPLLRSNNVRTIGTLLRFNGMVCKIVKDVLGVVPEYISSYDSRKYGYPELMGERKYKKNGDFIPQDKRTGKIVLFGDHPYTVDKKHVIYERVAAREPDIQWLYHDKGKAKGKLKNENYDMCDAYTCVMGYMRMNELWD